MDQQLPSALIKFIIYFLRGYQLWFFAAVICAILTGCYGTVNSYLSKILIDNVANSTGLDENLFKITLIPAILFVVSYELHACAMRGMNYIKIKIAPLIRNQIIEELFSCSQYHSYNFFQNNYPGAVANNINKVADCIEILLHHNFLFILRAVTQLIVSLIIMQFVNPIFSITLFIWVSFFLILSIKFANKIKILSDAYAEINADLSGKIIDSITNVSSVRLFAKEVYEIDYLKKYLNVVADKFKSKEWFMFKLWCVQGISITVLITIMLLTLIKLREHHLVTVGDFALILGLVLCVTENIWYLVELIDKSYDAIGQCNQGLKMIVFPHEIKDISYAKSLIVTKGEIKFHEISFSYKKKPILFHHLSITIIGGQKVGLVGLSGSGKTTFVNLIARLFDLSSGAITIDGQNISAVTLKSLRENIGFIPQDTALFHRSILENIHYGKNSASDEEMYLSSKKAHAHEFITLMPEGYHSRVGEKGTKISGGQRQRLSIARAILKNAPILVLDEATSALDSVTEYYIQESLSELMKDKTVIVIAHRLSTLLNLDRILVFDQGRIVEDGTHLELLAQNGVYAMLWYSQIGGFLPKEIDVNKFNTEKLNALKSLHVIT